MVALTRTVVNRRALRLRSGLLPWLLITYKPELRSVWRLWLGFLFFLCLPPHPALRLRYRSALTPMVGFFISFLCLRQLFAPPRHPERNSGQRCAIGQQGVPEWSRRAGD